MKRVLIGLGALVVLFGLFLGGLTLFDWTKSTEFCTLCHQTMEPETVAHQLTAHAEVDCGTCHVGHGTYWSVYYKLTNARYVVIYPFRIYERPLETPRSTLRPAEDVCGQCHMDGFYYEPKLVTSNQYGTDADNTLTQVRFLMKTGGGAVDTPGVGIGAHWHVENPVTYIAADEGAQEIQWVKATVDGEVKEYFAGETGLTAAQISAAEQDELDCMDCHNRSQHRIPPTAEAIDKAMDSGLIPADLPYVKSVAMEVLETRYETREEGNQAMAAVADRYQSDYPDVYAARTDDVKAAVAGLTTLFQQTHFPYMRQYWDTYPDNVGHTYTPGCMRCHDGDHMTADGEAIRAECNLCHSIPQVATGGAALSAVRADVGERPESHEGSLWIAEHQYKFDMSCEMCHTVGNPGGVDNSSFCSNSACHEREWPYLALDSEKVKALTVPVREPGTGEAPDVPHSIVEDMECTVCHGPDRVFAFPENHASYTPDLCKACHTFPAVAEEVVDVTPEPEVTEEPEATPEPTEEPEATSEPTAVAATPTAEPTTGGTAAATAAATVAATETASPATSGTAEATAEGTPAAEATPEAAATTETTPAAEEPSAGEGPLVAKEIPHTLDGREQCLTCHAIDGIEPSPLNHATFTEDDCQACHQEAGAEPVVTGKMSTEQCLTCHGPYSALQALTEDYQVNEMTVANPHTYVPHEEPDVEENIPLCRNCHDAHPIPAPEGMELEEPNLRWCYGACHHTGTLNPCSDCH
ncbi:MAG: hypothetical protein GXX93_13080 [Anaerolineae bacterium]|nr:hypothetical protein [Anaerolineae bacterium]